jgi:hypothetical protein
MKEEIKDERRPKIEKYVNDNYKGFAGKTLIITEVDNMFSIKHHINGNPLFLGQSILN